MGPLDLTIWETSKFCVLDVLSTVLLLWMTAAAVGWMRKLGDEFFALWLGLAVSVTVDSVVIGWEVWKSPVVAALLAVILAVVVFIFLLRWRGGGANSEASPLFVTAVSLGCLVVLTVAGGTAYALIRGYSPAVDFFSRLGLGTLILVLVFWLYGVWLRARFRRAITFTAAAGVIIVLLARGFYWRVLWSEPLDRANGTEQSAMRPGTTFPRLRVLREVSRGLEVAKEDLGKTVEHFRLAASVLEPEWWEENLADWTQQPTRFLLTVSFGGRVRLEEGEKALDLYLQPEKRRFLVLTDRGRIISHPSEDKAVAEVAFPPVGFGVIERSTLAVLGEAGELCLIRETGQARTISLPEGRYTGIAQAAGSLFILQSDGSVIRFQAGVTEEWLSPIWVSQDVARDIAVPEDGVGCYVLDAHGGIHPRGNTKISYADLGKHDRTEHYWPREQIGSSIQVTGDGFPVYGEMYGGLHAVWKEDNRLVYVARQREFPGGDRMSDFILAESFSAVYILSETGNIRMVPDYGWIGPQQR